MTACAPRALGSNQTIPYLLRRAQSQRWRQTCSSVTVRQCRARAGRCAASQWRSLDAGQNCLAAVCSPNVFRIWDLRSKAQPVVRPACRDAASPHADRPPWRAGAGDGRARNDSHAAGVLALRHNWAWLSIRGRFWRKRDGQPPLRRPLWRRCSHGRNQALDLRRMQVPAFDVRPSPTVVGSWSVPSLAIRHGACTCRCAAHRSSLLLQMRPWRRALADCRRCCRCRRWIQTCCALSRMAASLCWIHWRGACDGPAQPLPLQRQQIHAQRLLPLRPRQRRALSQHRVRAAARLSLVL